ncbi:MAG: hypothetical protein BWX88_04882 [Planctomycetes bacterium ADurb.Bin126]|nr:MAG: hypothetical protein BWX88_04882 [Planctomycetes bacterium ADurb.Bin126]
MAKRMKASDIFNQSNFVFAEKVSFAQAFPEIDSIRVTVTEDGYGVTAGYNTRTYSTSSIGEYVNCSNSLCYNGGFDLGSIIRQIVRERRTHAEEHRACQGYEGSPKGRRRYRSCINSFEIVVDITYKEAAQKNETPVPKQ